MTLLVWFMPHQGCHRDCLSTLVNMQYCHGRGRNVRFGKEKHHKLYIWTRKNRKMRPNHPPDSTPLLLLFQANEIFMTYQSAVAVCPLVHRRRFPLFSSPKRHDAEDRLVLHQSDLLAPSKGKKGGRHEIADHLEYCEHHDAARSPPGCCWDCILNYELCSVFLFSKAASFV